MAAAAAALAVAVAACFWQRAPRGVAVVTERVEAAGVPRFGLNLGFRTSWGAEQLLSNVVMNPGFEGVVDRCLVEVQPLDEQRFRGSVEQPARPDGFWAGATFDIRTGLSAGQGGRIRDSRATARGAPEFRAEGALPPLDPGDIIAVTRISDEGLPAQWWFPQPSAVSTVPDPRPGSGGRRALCLRAAEAVSYLDAIGDRAGRLLPVAGRWRLAFWIRGEGRLAVRFGRQDGAVFLDRAWRPGATWQRTTVAFEASGDPGRGLLELRFSASGRVLLDDVELAAEADEFVFRGEVLAALRAIRPGYLRDWQGQLGDTMDNRLAPPDARRSGRYRPGGAEASDFGYSLPEFLDLCRQVDARPWLVAPTTFSDAEWAGLGGYLAGRAAADHFSEILIEFGNENWNSVFRPAAIADPVRHAAAAGRGFDLLLRAAGGLPIRRVVNAQHANPSVGLTLLRAARSADLIAVAPYFMRELRATTPAATALGGLFAGDGGSLGNYCKVARDLQREVAAAEVNLHTTAGDAAPAERDPVVAGAAAGTALAWHLLEALRLGVRRQCVYTLSGFDAGCDGGGRTRLWGVVRDLSPRWRPTGLALILLNRAAAGDLHACRQPYEDVRVAPFRTSRGWSAAVVSACSQARTVRLRFPRGAAPPRRVLWLDAREPLATNEDGERVRIAEGTAETDGGDPLVRLPPYGMAVLLPEGNSK